MFFGKSKLFSVRKVMSYKIPIKFPMGCGLISHYDVSLRALLDLGVFNCRSAVNKAASVHTLISDFGLDVIALSETWMAADAP